MALRDALIERSGLETSPPRPGIWRLTWPLGGRSSSSARAAFKVGLLIIDAVRSKAPVD